MNKEFYAGNRKSLYQKLEAGSLVVVFSGHAPIKTNDENYPFFTNRNFLYLTGIEQENIVLMAYVGEGTIEETLYLLPQDAFAERWTGRRIKEEEAEELSGITNYKYVAAFRNDLSRQLFSGNVKKVYLDFDKVYENTPAVEAYRLGKYLKEHAPFVGLGNLHPIMKQLRLIKKPCEIEAMKKAETITKAGIEAMMKTSKPGMYEYQYKAEFDYALAQRGVLSPGFPSIISSGKNNFKIHYYDYRGQAQDGDMILNDVGAVWDYEINDVSRAFPCNGRFNDRQKLLYECIYNTSEYMFSTLKPGVPLLDVDKIIRKYTFEQLKEAGVCKNFEDIGTYMWHGGAHHVGFDVHDVVEGSGLTVPGVVFCVDIGVYHEEWGIGFRLEDNCLITEDGCENLSRAIPRQIDEIEAFIGCR